MESTLLHGKSRLHKYDLFVKIYTFYLTSSYFDFLNKIKHKIVSSHGRITAGVIK